MGQSNYHICVKCASNRSELSALHEIECFLNIVNCSLQDVVNHIMLAVLSSCCVCPEGTGRVAFSQLRSFSSCFCAHGGAWLCQCSIASRALSILPRVRVVLA